MAMQANAIGKIDPRTFAFDPIRYAEEYLGILTLTPEQKEILPLVHIPPYKVLVPAAHDVGKTFMMAVLTSYWYDCFQPSVVLTTAPTSRDVCDVLWTEIRLQRGRAGIATAFAGEQKPYMGDHREHFAKGFTAQRGEMFKGRHRRRMLFLFDEANEIDESYWTTTKTMFDPSDGHAWMCCYNPTTTTTQAYQECLQCGGGDGESPQWHLRRLSALRHPNVVAGLRGESKPIPGAVSLEMIAGLVRDWCDPVGGAGHEATDVEWPPGSGMWFRPGPDFQSRVLGVEPDDGDGLWSLSLLEAMLQEPAQWEFAWEELPQLGCDCSLGRGRDWMAIHGRWGAVSIHHETSNTMDPATIVGRLKQVAQDVVAFANALRPPQAAPWWATDVPIKIDDDGIGGAVGSFLQREGYRAVLVGAATKPHNDERYRNRRSELWFQSREKAKSGRVVLAHPRIDAGSRRRLRQQLLAVSWRLHLDGRREVDRKDDIKEKIGRSPDDADAFNLAYDSTIPAMKSHGGETSAAGSRQERGRQLW